MKIQLATAGAKWRKVSAARSVATSFERTPLSFLALPLARAGQGPRRRQRSHHSDDAHPPNPAVLLDAQLRLQLVHACLLRRPFFSDVSLDDPVRSIAWLAAVETPLSDHLRMVGPRGDIAK